MAALSSGACCGSAVTVKLKVVYHCRGMAFELLRHRFFFFPKKKVVELRPKVESPHNDSPGIVTSDNRLAGMLLAD